MNTLLGGSIGNFIECYDWCIYGLLSAAFAPQMFPSHDPTTSLILAYGSFAVGFVARPVGSLLFSPLADRYGRRSILGITILLAGLGSLIITVTPTYASIGLAAPVILTLARLLQGLSAGGEMQIASAFLNEHAGDSNRAVKTCGHMVGTGLSVLAATLVISLSSRLAPAEWAWRLPFLVGAVISLFGIYVRRGLSETPVFIAQKSHGVTLRALAVHWRELFIVFAVSSTCVHFYLWMIFMPGYATKFTSLSADQAFAASSIAMVIYCASLPLWAALSDRIGRKPQLIGGVLGNLILIYPLLNIIRGSSFTVFLICESVGVLLNAMTGAAIGSFFSELFPTSIRSTGTSIPYALSLTLFGGTTPMLATYLLKDGHNGPLALYVVGVSALSLLTHLVLTPETLGRSLHDANLHHKVSGTFYNENGLKSVL